MPKKFFQGVSSKLTKVFMAEASSTVAVAETAARLLTDTPSTGTSSTVT